MYDGNRYGDDTMLDRPAPDAPQTAPADTAPDGEQWEAKVKNVLKAELKRRGIGYKELADKLNAIGVPENEPNIRNKLARGRFTAVFLMQVMAAIGAETIRLA